MKNIYVGLLAKALLLCVLNNPRLKSGIIWKIQTNWVLTLKEVQFVALLEVSLISAKRF
jgi:hypothetical protein